MSERTITAGIIGKDGRTSAMTRALAASPRVARVVTLSTGKAASPAALLDDVVRAARAARPDLVVVGPEDPLAHGVVDALWHELRIPSVGPTKRLAQLEASKAFTRRLLARHDIPGNPQHRVFESMDGIEDYLTSLTDFVVKPDGLTGGKGVKVSGVHLQSVRDAVEYCEELFAARQPRIVIEEKLDGEEFSLQSFCDGVHVAHMPPVQDHKRAFEGDTGPNTGGMGSYSDADHSLPFLDPDSLAAAKRINERVGRALYDETGERYKGVLFGGFMATKDGVRLLEYNARFGDPESLNVLSLLETDFAAICESIVQETLDTVPITFRPAATVCKYIVPEGYPNQPVKGRALESPLPAESDGLRVYEAAVERRDDGRLYMTGSRAIALVGIAPDLARAQEIAEAAAASIEGPVFYRKDIGTPALIERRIRHMEQIRGVQARR